MRRALLLTLLALGAFAVLLYAVGLGIYAVTSTEPAVGTQPASPEEAAQTLARLDLRAEYPFPSRFDVTPHGRMHYVDVGSGPAVLCLHGNPTWSFLYRHLVDALSDRARVVAPDLIGFGLSEKLPHPDDYSLDGHIEDVSALVERLDLRKLTLVVQGWGGPVGLGLALRHPERIRALVVMNSFAFVPPAIRDGRRVRALSRLARMPVLGEELVQGLGVLHRVALPAELARDQRRTPPVLRAYRVVQPSWQERAAALAFPRLLPPDGPAEVLQLLDAEDRWLRAFQGPVLLLWGLRDPVFGSPVLAAWRERLPHARIVEIRDAGHLLPEDAPGEVGAHLRAFLQDLPV